MAEKKKPKKDTEKESSVQKKKKRKKRKTKSTTAHKTKKSDDSLLPEINIGLVGHVDHGKTTLLESFSGKWADTHSEEIKRGITIRLGYADTTFRKCRKCDTYTTKEKCPECDSETDILRKVSFVDAPGHESLMATMLAGTTIMDGALLLVAVNEECPQPQTREHLMALEIIGIKNIIVIQNKIDLVSEEDAIKNHKEIKEFLKNTPFKNAPIIPISAQHNVGISSLIGAIEKTIPTPKRSASLDPIFLVARSFDINKPSSKTDNLVGGVFGGALIQGELKNGSEIMILPGYEVIEKNQKIFKPLKTKIIDIKTGSKSVDKISPGGSVGILTSLDPGIVKSDKLSGSVVGVEEKLPPVHYQLKLAVTLLERVVGTEKNLDVEPIKMTEALMLNVNSAATVGIVTELRKNAISCRLKLPVCADIGARVTISRMIGNRFRLIGYGLIQESS
ncbi:MAG: translation initiation factor IF-2 subunit gamma [Nanoarchaeota archaeon]|nr:translation initiation factor IF-2 subunit gamma [Nanoarchaeota archaeon]